MPFRPQPESGPSAPLLTEMSLKPVVPEELPIKKNGRRAPSAPDVLWSQAPPLSSYHWQFLTHDLELKLAP